jgi:hypothetical protein
LSRVVSRDSTGIARESTPDRPRASARLGLTLRSVLLAPSTGFGAAIKVTERRARSGRRPIEGFSSYLFAAVGGASLASLWLKLGALFKLRQVCTVDYVPAYIATTFVLGALIGLIAQAIWGNSGTALARTLRGDTEPHRMRLVWGAAAVPQTLVLLILLPLDLLIVGTDSFTTRPLDESLSTAWAAFSIAIALSLAVWSLYIFVRGVQVVGALNLRKALIATAAAIGCFGIVVGMAVVGASFIPTEGTCPTRPG